MALNFDTLFNTLVEEIGKLVVNALQEYGKNALVDAKSIIEKSKGDLLRWSELYATGKLSWDEVESLLRNKKALLDMDVLVQAGLSLIALDKLQADILNTIVGVLKK